ncbi:MAG TPA: glycoside hydrolase family 31 protein [Chloroflexia bacterium]|nr:glycoside hydrolase family 31 protein [Chloroflexia bacterium]
MFQTDGKRLIWSYDFETLWIEPWGENALRVRGSQASLLDDYWALLPVEVIKPEIIIETNRAYIKNGRIKAEIDSWGKVNFYNNSGKSLLQEFSRDMHDRTSPSPLHIKAREFKPEPGGSDYAITVRFESDPEEKLFGMGQYQHDFLDLKNCTLELAQRNSQASVPFVLSDLGYGFLWNNPAVGRVTFGKNMTEWSTPSTRQLDYWITAGDTPAEIEEAYAAVTGKVPMMPEFGMGFWQCKLRYQTQAELLEVAHEYKRRNLPISVIVIDFFHWTRQGEWKFDPTYWPEPAKMIRELKELGIELMVSIWPTVEVGSENYDEMLEKGYLVKTDRGVRTNFYFQGSTSFFDATNPAARKYVWEIIKKNYYDKGIKTFWLDEAEPEYSAYDFDHFRYQLGSVQQVGNIYPAKYSQALYDGMVEQGDREIVNLVRCAWAGSQRYGALVWSGDIHSSFKSLAIQVKAGLNMAIAGIPWWTSDIGGFRGGNPNDPAFRECIIRWFQYGAFCPVFRLHGDRVHDALVKEDKLYKRDILFPSGAANEVWSYGEEAYGIFQKYMELRERLRPYIRSIMMEAHEKGTPVMRPMFYDFPEDKQAWKIEDQFMFGPEVLVAPVLEEGARERKVYIPAGYTWRAVDSGEKIEGGQWIKSPAPLDHLPLFVKDGSSVLNLI